MGGSTRSGRTRARPERDTCALLTVSGGPDGRLNAEVLDAVAARHSGVEVVRKGQRRKRQLSWVFPDAAAAVAAAIQIRIEASGPESASLRIIVDSADTGALRPGDRIWPPFEPPGLEDDAAVGVSRLHNAPLPSTSFVGREAEIGACIDALAAGRVLTLTGAGGCGKTRLALELARRTALLYPDGAWWVDLTALASPASVPQVAQVVGRALGLWLDTEADAAASLVDFLKARRTLVVLDNCEHLLEACRDLVDRVAGGDAAVCFLATSREPLGAGAETARRVPSLQLPDVEEEVARSEAGRLFAVRARAVRPNFVITSENAGHVQSICRRLDGIPLALELAAARIRLLTPDRISAGLADDFRLLGASEARPARQQTLEASVAWSYGLCSAPEQTLLRRLGVFSSSFLLDAVEAVGEGGALDRYAVLDLLDRLIDRSLVAVDDAPPDRRFKLLESVRMFASRHLVESGEEEAARDRHLAYFTGLAEAAEEAIPRPGGLAWLPRLENDYANLLAALEWASTREDPDPLTRLATALALPWEMRGRFADGSSWLSRAVERGPQAGGDVRRRVRALWARAHLAIYAADFATALAIAPDALRLADAIGDPKAASRLRNTMGFALCYSDPPAALKMLEDSIELGAAAGDAWAVADSTKFLTVATLIAGDVEGCEAAVVKLRQVATQLGNAFFLGWCDGAHGYCQLLRGRFGDAIDRFDRSMAAAAEVGDPATLGIVQAWRAYALARLGRYGDCRAQVEEFLARTILQGGGLGTPFARIAVAVADLEEGQTFAGAAGLEQVAAWTVQAGDTMSALWALPLCGQALVLAGRQEEAEAMLADALQMADPPVDNPWSRAQALYGQGLLAQAKGDPVSAENLLHRALALQHSRGFVADELVSLRFLAALAARAESWQEAARIVGGVDAAGAALGLVVSYHQRQAREIAEEACRAALGPAGFDSALAEGAALNLDDLVAYASRARGTRSRPIHGWESLTPTERRVVEWVAHGLTNPEIGGRLFVSKATIKTHLAHVFAKLGVSTRSELAAEAARRGAAGDAG